MRVCMCDVICVRECAFDKDVDRQFSHGILSWPDIIFLQFASSSLTISLSSRLDFVRICTKELRSAHISNPGMLSAVLFFIIFSSYFST